jgi:hypothetical protein
VITRERPDLYPDPQTFDLDRDQDRDGSGFGKGMALNLNTFPCDIRKAPTTTHVRYSLDLPRGFVHRRDVDSSSYLRCDEVSARGPLVVHGPVADLMIIYGPTLGADHDTPTGSLHLHTLPNSGAGREFVAVEPISGADVYREIQDSHGTCALQSSRAGAIS